MARSKPLEERFWEKVDKNGPTPAHTPHLGQCWVWTRCCNEDGYGKIGEGAPSRKMLYAHRVSWKLHNGPIPVGEGYHGTCVCHACDNRKCVNPAHLWLGTIADDHLDRDKKGRQTRGEDVPQSKLTEEKVAEIRRDYVRGSRTHGQRALARKHHVAHSSIGCIVRGEKWK